jgi:hypothetical protein
VSWEGVSIGIIEPAGGDGRWSGAFSSLALRLPGRSCRASSSSLLPGSDQVRCYAVARAAAAHCVLLS